MPEPKLIRVRPGPLRFADPIPEDEKIDHAQAPGKWLPGGALDTSEPGEWWPISPFTSKTPWLPLVTRDLPDGFVEVYGPEPVSTDFDGDYTAFRAARVKWEQDLEHFKQAGTPEWAEPKELRDSAAIFKAWGMGAPVYFEGRYGWSARFPKSQLPTFEAAARTTLEYTHLVVAQYQLALREAGLDLERKHPFTPPAKTPDDAPAPTAPKRKAAPKKAARKKAAK